MYVEDENPTEDPSMVDCFPHRSFFPIARRPCAVKIYVGNLSFYTNEETLQGVFEEFGDVYDCYIPLDPNTERPRGFAFVTMDADNGKRAIAELDNLELDGRFIRVNEAQGKKKQAPSFSRTEGSYTEEEGGFYSM
jgi:RNA recognition motif-containing protein